MDGLAIYAQGYIKDAVRRIKASSLVRMKGVKKLSTQVAGCKKVEKVKGPDLTPMYNKWFAGIHYKLTTMRSRRRKRIAG